MLRHLWPSPQRPARVVVMGAGGFVGDALARRLERDSVTVLRLTRRDVDLIEPRVSERLAALLRPEDVLVAVSAVVPCKTTEMLRDNVVIASAMAAAARHAGLAQLVNIGSDALYADSRKPLTEKSVTAPDSLHGIMHLAREMMFRSEIKVPLTLLRPTLIYGAGDPHDGYGPNRFRRLVARSEPIVLFGRGEERRDHVFIDDVAELAARVIYHRSVGILNIATGFTTSFRDIAEAVVKLSGRTVPVQESQRAGPMPHGGYRAFDVSACVAAFPEFSFTPLAEGLARAQGDLVPARTEPESGVGPVVPS